MPMPPTESSQPCPPPPPAALPGKKDGHGRILDLNGVGVGGGAILIDGTIILKQQVEFAKRKVSDAAKLARNIVVPNHDSSRIIVAASDATSATTTTAAAAAATAAVEGTTTTTAVDKTNEMTSKNNTSNNNNNNNNHQFREPSLLQEHQFHQKNNHNNDRSVGKEEGEEEVNIIFIVSSIAIVGLAIILQQTPIATMPSPTFITAVVYFVLGCSVDRIWKNIIIAYHNCYPRQSSSSGSCRRHKRGDDENVVLVDAATQTSSSVTSLLSSTSVGDGSTHVSFADEHAINNNNNNNNHQRPQTTTTGAHNYYLEKTKQLLSQHSLMGGENGIHIRRYSNLLLHPPSVVPSSSRMVAMMTGREDAVDDDDEGVAANAATIREARRRAPFADGPLMDHLLKYSDFRRLKKTMDVVAKVVRASSARSGSKSAENDEMNWEEDEEERGDDDGEDSEEGEEEVKEEEEEEEEGAGEELGVKTGTILVGKAKLNNIRASRVFKHVVNPLCSLRGMDLFLTDTPEEEIWRQPMLNECGLRDVPTLVANMMLPFGNMTAYFKLPDWFDDWSNIPAERIDDPPDIRAFKRFLSGDAEYRARAKVIPYIVDGPLAIRMIRPPRPKEVPIHAPRHPATWTNVPKSVDATTGKTNCAILECDVDCVSDKKMRKLINIVRPFMHTITVDMAFIIAKPESSSIDDPCACLGLWRVDKVDFESCAVFPERTLDEVAEEMKLIMSIMEEQCKEA